MPIAKFFLKMTIMVSYEAENKVVKKWLLWDTEIQ